MNTPIAEEYRKQAEALARRISGLIPNSDELDYDERDISDLIATALQAAADTAREWNSDMNAAPKDGTEILMYTKGRQQLEGYWSEDNQAWILRFYDEENDILAVESGCEIFHMSPTHWKHLPAAPHTTCTAQQCEVTKGYNKKWLDIPKDLKAGDYLVSCETDDGLQVCVMEYKNNKWIYEGQYTFQHGFYIEPIKYQELPKPHDDTAENEAVIAKALGKNLAVMKEGADRE